MLKAVLTILLISVYSRTTVVESFYSQKMKNIDNQPVDLNAFQSKKVMFLVLPGNLEDTLVTPAKINQVLSMREDLIIVGVPAEEAGYTEQKKNDFKAYYSSLESRFILAEGMKVSPTAGLPQASIFSWLTTKEKSNYLDVNDISAGYKFFVNGEGRLYAVISGNTPLTSLVVQKVLSR